MKYLLILSLISLTFQIQGIDVSVYQGNIDWVKAKNAGVKFAIIRAGYGREISQKDTFFDTNYANAKAAGMPIGAYWYAYATTTSGAEAEANTCMSILSGHQFEWPIYYDIEEQSIFETGKATVSAIAKTFCSALEKKKYFCGIYSSANPLNNLFDEEVKTRFAIWVAHYDVDKPGYTGDWGIWQYSSKGSVAGIFGDVDMDKAVIDYEPIIKKGHFNGY